MLVSHKIARTKWCPCVRIDNNNRLHNSITDGFQNSEKTCRCIAVRPCRKARTRLKLCVRRRWRRR